MTGVGTLTAGTTAEVDGRRHGVAGLAAHRLANPGRQRVGDARRRRRDPAVATRGRARRAHRAPDSRRRRAPSACTRSATVSAAVVIIEVENDSPEAIAVGLRRRSAGRGHRRRLRGARRRDAVLAYARRPGAIEADNGLVFPVPHRTKVRIALTARAASTSAHCPTPTRRRAPGIGSSTAGCARSCRIRCSSTSTRPAPICCLRRHPGPRSSRWRHGDSTPRPSRCGSVFPCGPGARLGDRHRTGVLGEVHAALALEHRAALRDPARLPHRMARAIVGGARHAAPPWTVFVRGALAWRPPRAVVGRPGGHDGYGACARSGLVERRSRSARRCWPSRLRVCSRWGSPESAPGSVWKRRNSSRERAPRRPRGRGPVRLGRRGARPSGSSCSSSCSTRSARRSRSSSRPTSRVGC